MLLPICVMLEQAALELVQAAPMILLYIVLCNNIMAYRIPCIPIKPFTNTNYNLPYQILKSLVVIEQFDSWINKDE